ncbi:hypothetical protein ACQP0C_25295 [Nocardia sp. CA-129566]|uniref:hypothetical protein n=1 Tax=Nocardia sp. CA-129566 TaxID=3239976 RepID=UPI003D98A803
MRMAQRIDRVCELLADASFVATAATIAATPLLDRIAQAVRTGIAHTALESELNALDQLFAQHGIDHVTTGSRHYSAMPGVSGHPSMRAKVCPAPQRCARVVLVSGTANASTCALVGTALGDAEVHS